MGRRSMLTPERSSKIVNAVKAGNYLETAAQYGGITAAGLHKWLKRGRDERERIENGEEANENESRYVEFVEAVENARAEAEVRAVALIQQAGQAGTWQASAWYLERSYPARWGRREKVEHSGPDGGPITLQGLADLMGVKTKKE